MISFESLPLTGALTGFFLGLALLVTLFAARVWSRRNQSQKARPLLGWLRGLTRRNPTKGALVSHHRLLGICGSRSFQFAAEGRRAAQRN